MSLTAPTSATSTSAATLPALRRLTGLKPTGHLQLGNLIGAIRPMVAAQRDPSSDAIHTYVAVVDLHALTVDHHPHDVRALTLEHATLLLAAGLDPDRGTCYVQSQVPEHTELHYLLECVTGVGEVQRMIQFREEAARQRHTRLSLLTYPVLMAADILLLDTDEVPVGEDQTQHLELARTIAARFNARYGDTFTVPRAAKPPVGARIMNLAEPGTKMDKSAASGAGVLYLLDPPDVVRRKISRAVTDGDGAVRYAPERQPGVSNLLEILAACTGTDPVAAATGLTSYRRLKDATTEAVIGLLAPLQRSYRQLAGDRNYVEQVLATGAERVRAHATGTVARARRALGLR